MRVIHEKLFDGTTLSGTTLVTSKIINLFNIYTYAIQYIATGSVFAGTLQIYGSCDEGIGTDGTGVTNWAPVGSAITISAATNTIVNQDAVGWKWFKIEFTPNNGTGALTILGNFKGP